LENNKINKKQIILIVSGKHFVSLDLQKKTLFRKFIAKLDERL